MTVIEDYSAFATDMKPSREAVHAAKRCLLDWYGAAIAGSAQPPATLLRRAFTGQGDAWLVPEREARDPRTAALINATASHIVEVDDIYRSGLYHPGVVTIPAALALGQANRITGQHLLHAIIAGYEVSNRIARTVNPTHYQHWHTTGTVGHFGAAVAASVALQLNATQTAHAIATAATFAAGLRYAFSSDAMSKPLHAGRAAEAGVAVAQMAQMGVTGVLEMLEGERGFGVAMSADVDWAAATETLGSEWTIVDTTPKAHACCGHNFAALDAIGILMQEHDLNARDVERVEIATYKAALQICGNANPVSPAEARFSLPYCAAVMVHQGSVSPLAFTSDALDNHDVRAFTDKIAMSVCRDADNRFPNARSATVTLRLANGQRVSHHRPTRRGDPDDPMTDRDLEAKFLELAAPIIGDATAQAFLLSVNKVESIQDVNMLCEGTA